MNIAEMFASYRFVFSCLMAAGGIVCIFYGYRLFADGSGLYKSVDKLAITHHEFNVSITGMSAGGLLMLTSAAWGYFAYASIPRLEAAGDTVKIVGKPTKNKIVQNNDKAQAKFTAVIGLPVVDPNGKHVGTVSNVAFDNADKKWKAIIKAKGTTNEPSTNKSIDFEYLTVKPDKVTVVPFVGLALPPARHGK